MFDQSESDLSDVPVDGATLRGVFAGFPSPVVAVCAEIDGAPTGFAVSTFVPVSLDPPLVSFCVQNTSATWPALAGASRLGLSLLGTDQHAAARSLGTRDGDRFRDVAVRRGRDGAVFVAGAAVWLETEPEATVPAGDHTVVLARIRRVATRPDSDPLVFHGSKFRRLHREPADAES